MGWDRDWFIKPNYSHTFRNNTHYQGLSTEEAEFQMVNEKFKYWNLIAIIFFILRFSVIVVFLNFFNTKSTSFYEKFHLDSFEYFENKINWIQSRRNYFLKRFIMRNELFGIQYYNFTFLTYLILLCKICCLSLQAFSKIYWKIRFWNLLSDWN